MRSSGFRIRFHYVEKNRSRDDVDRCFEYVCRTLCLQAYDTETAKQILRLLLQEKQGLSSTEIARRLQKSRGAVINQLNRLINAGLVSKHGRIYTLRASSFAGTIEEMHDDIERIMKNLYEAASQLDKEFDDEFF